MASLPWHNLYLLQLKIFEIFPWKNGNPRIAPPRYIFLPSLIFHSENKLNFLVQNLCDILFGQVHRDQRFSEKRDDLFLSGYRGGGVWRLIGRDVFYEWSLKKIATFAHHFLYFSKKEVSKKQAFSEMIEILETDY